MPTFGSFQGRGSYLSLCRACFFTTEKRDVSSTNSFTLHDTFSGRSLTYTRKNNGPRTDPWGTPADTVDQLEDFRLIQHVVYDHVKVFDKPKEITTYAIAFQFV